MICPTCGITVEITQVALAVECPHPEVVLQYIREEQEETRKPLTADDMLRGAEIIEDGAEDKKH
jgi:hypothetical protein